MPVDTETTLALIPKTKDDVPNTPTIPRSYVMELEHALKQAGWKATGSKDGSGLGGVAKATAESFELTLSVKQTVRSRSGSGTV